ncbi:Lactamase-like protein nscB [Pseudocercospora fuligena]|uniref:Lactamase-like protein nscB n=1 Tax=Pseudocercospora fuligena TaxID=685502 RepID=A0A8H6RRN3_9PEZI|nr:Lactamase-like protein nscB [Pseudocercospora fuligena]
MEQLPHLPDIERLSPRVIRILGGNPSKFTLQGTNTYLIGTGNKRLLLDTAEGKPIWKTSLQKVLQDENATIDKIILTHWHPDHVGGVEDAKEVSGNEGVKVYKNQTEPGKDQVDFQDGEVFEVEGAKIKALHSPGHTIDHMSFILEEENAMFTGDNVLGHGTAVFEDLATYINSLHKMEAAFTGKAYPAHGAVIEDGPRKVREYIEHRRQREEEVLRTLEGKKPGKTEGWTSMDSMNGCAIKRGMGPSP